MAFAPCQAEYREATRRRHGGLRSVGFGDHEPAGGHGVGVRERGRRSRRACGSRASGRSSSSTASAPIGILTERDLVRFGGRRRRPPPSTRVSEWMTAEPDCVGTRASTSPLRSRSLAEHGYRHIPVVDGERLVGIVSMRDLMRVAQIQPAEHLAHDVPARAQGRGRRRDRRSATSAASRASTTTASTTPSSSPRSARSRTCGTCSSRASCPRRREPRRSSPRSPPCARSPLP